MVFHDDGSPNWRGDAPRRRMIAETNAFLNWALRQDVHLPRIPTRRVDEGGFRRLLKHPAARTAAQWWWGRTLKLLDRFDHKS